MIAILSESDYWRHSQKVTPSLDITLSTYIRNLSTVKYTKVFWTNFVSSKLVKYFHHYCVQVVIIWYVHILVVIIVLTSVAADMLAPLLSSFLTTSTCAHSHAQCRAVRPNYIMIRISTITTCHNIHCTLY